MKIIYMILFSIFLINFSLIDAKLGDTKEKKNRTYNDLYEEDSDKLMSTGIFASD